MTAYGRGQTLGSGINPESFKMDFSGFARAADIQAQGIANLGSSIGGAIEDFGKAKEERKKIEAETKASRAGIESAIKLGDSLGFDVKGMLSPVLSKMDDPNTTPLEAAALGREASAQIANVLNLGFKAQDYANQRAQLQQDAAYKNAQLEIAQQNAITSSIPKVKRQRVKKTGVFNGEEVEYDIYVDPNNPQNAIYEDGTPVYGSNGQTSAAVESGLNLPMPTAGGTLTPGVDPAPNYGSFENAMNLDSGVLPEKEVTKEQIQNQEQLAQNIRNNLTGGQGDTSSVLPIAEGTPAAAPITPMSDVPAMQDGGGLPPGARLKEKKTGVWEDAVINGRVGQRNTKTGEFKQYQSDPIKTERESLMVKELFDTKKNLASATQTKQSVTRLLTLLDEGVETGFGRDILMKFNRAFGKDVSDSEAFKSVAGDVAMDFINLTKGAISDREMLYFTTVLAPNLGNSVEGNKKIGDFMLKAVKKAEKIEGVISEGLKKGEGAFDIDQKAREIRDADDILAEPKSESSDSAIPQSATDKLKAKLLNRR